MGGAAIGPLPAPQPRPQTYGEYRRPEEWVEVLLMLGDEYLIPDLAPIVVTYLTEPETRDRPPTHVPS